MRATISAALFALSFLPAIALAQTSNPQSANADAAAATAPAPPRSGGITREQFIQRAQDRAARRAAAQFDRMDIDHDGVLEPVEMRAWRSQHARNATSRSDQLPPQ